MLIILDKTTLPALEGNDTFSQKQFQLDLFISQSTPIRQPTQQ